MQTEIEAKFLDVDVSHLRTQLTSVGAVCVHEERLMRRNNFDFPDKRLEAIGGWVRLRDEGDKVTLAYKQLLDRSLEGTKEVEVIVSDFTKTAELLSQIGLVSRTLQESKRERWQMDTVEVTIDTWPHIPTYVELEAPSEDELRAATARLGLPWEQAMHGSVETAYQAYYDITEQEFNALAELTFGMLPSLLLHRKR